MKHQESQLQRTCVSWFNAQYPECRGLLFAIPNGGKRNAREAAIMKGEGVVAGVADLMLALPSADCHGVFIEMKTPIGKQTEAQKAWQARITKHGYRYEIVRSVDEFIEIVKRMI